MITMVTANITFKDVDDTLGFAINLPQRVEKSGNAVLNSAANFVERSAKVRASAKDRWAASGELARSIKVMPGKNKRQVIVSADARSALYQETGFTPHFVSMEHLSERVLTSMKNYNLGRQKLGTGNGHRGMIFVTKQTPYLEPALDAMEEVLDSIIDIELTRLLG